MGALKARIATNREGAMSSLIDWVVILVSASYFWFIAIMYVTS